MMYRFQIDNVPPEELIKSCLINEINLLNETLDQKRTHSSATCYPIQNCVCAHYFLIECRILADDYKIGIFNRSMIN